MPLSIIRNDITKVKADAIVNTANPEVAIGYGVDSAIYKAAGEDELLAERAKIGPMTPGQAAATPAFALNADYIIHTVGPAWQGGGYGEREAVASCYRESLRIADELHCESVAFPLISTGTYGFPKDEALNIAVREISSFLFTHDMTVYMVVYDLESFVISGKAFADIKSYIDERDVKEPEVDAVMYNTTIAGGKFPERESIRRRRQQTFRREKRELISEEAIEKDIALLYDEMLEAEVPPAESSAFEGSLDDLVRGRTEEETFQEMLFRLIDRKGIEDPDVYKKANMDRKLFSKIRSNKYYKPSKKTALALAVALELNLDETIDLLRRAGLALSPNSKFDLILGYCIDHKMYNVYEINNILFKYEEPLLGY